MIVHEMEQYSPEWWAAREGIPTASAADKLITAKGGNLSTQIKAYLNQLLADRMGFAEEGFVSDWMLRGKELEPEARAAFTFLTGQPTIQVGFVTNDAGTAGASPDALIQFAPDITNQFKAGLEIKCPKPSTQIGRLLNPVLPDAYKQQVHMGLAITGLPLWYWMSYHPDFEPVIVQVPRDEYTEKVETVVAEFLKIQRLAMEKLGIE